MLWIYSDYLRTNSITKITDDSIANFSKEYFKIVPGYNYGYIAKTFTRQSSIMKGKHIVVQSEEMLKRLVYVLRLLSQRDSDRIFKYYTNKVIQNYYEDITDFKKSKNQIILYGEESVNKLITENNIKYTLHNEIKIDSPNPYFFKNKLIDNKVYLAQNTTSLEKATNIAVIWFTEEYNPGFNSEVTKPLSFTLYSYINGDNITAYKIKGKSFFYNIKILGYKIDNTSFYTTLLPLS